ncbi:hypothetical protein Scep_015505 [Stephania cephalantha]|uniref:Protein kinase domain-containing protein n=1 Tax=Stephania cephalantha TaxID=152367 RepID=A0AAP0J3A3_9MAGN
MCGSRKKTEAIEPNSTPLHLRKRSPTRSSTRTTIRSSPSPSGDSRKHTDPSTSYGVNTNTNTNTNSSGTSSCSSRASLASLRNSLPENPNIYDFSHIRKATNNFLTKRFSSSSTSQSWRCAIRGKDVVVIQRKFRRPIETPELRRVLSEICKCHHSALIKLHGASISGDHIYLVYDYVAGADLASCLRNPKSPYFTILSNWMSRMQVAMDLAQGLEYIHHYTGLDLGLVHNHIKSSSVIVTEPSFNAIICHFGASELCGEIVRRTPPHQQNQSRLHGKTSEIEEIEEEHDSSSDSRQVRRSNSKLMRVQGTRGYMSPEFLADGAATAKSDVYAFGVVVLELLSGEEAQKYTMNEATGEISRGTVIEAAREAVSDTWRLRRWVDSRLRDSFPVDVAEKMTRLALECVDVDPERRPDMRHVAGQISRFFLESKGRLIVTNEALLEAFAR